MFDIGWQELFIVAVFALIVVGPKDLPQAIRTITTWVRKARMMARDFQSGVNEMVREAELDDIKDSLTKPQDMKKTIADMVDPDGELAKGLVLEEGEEKALGSAPLKDASAEDTENMTGEEGDPSEAGEPHQFEILNQPVDDDVMPIPAAPSDDKAESKS